MGRALKRRVDVNSAHRRMLAGWEILSNHERNNNSPATAG